MIIALQTSTGKPLTITATSSFDHYLANMKLLEFNVNCNSSLSMTTSQAGFFMYTSLLENTCQLYYHPPGTKFRNLSRGRHQLLLIQFKPEWLIYKCSRLSRLRSFSSFFHQSHQQPAFLPSYAIAGNLLKAFKKMHAINSDTNRDKACYAFINDCIDKYYSKYTDQNTIGNYHRDKATEIAAFVNEYYATDLVESLPNLANRFMVSERHLARLAKMAFGIPLHSQVIKIRMSSGLNHLMTTDMPIREIAQLIGYREPYYFSKAFKKCFGVSPKYLSKR